MKEPQTLQNPDNNEVQTPLRLTRRGKTAAAALTALTLLGGANELRNFNQNPYEQELKEGKYIEYVVQPGDTADQLARSVVGPEKEKRQLSGELYDQATSDGTPMTPGEVLRIPLSEVHNEDSIVVRQASATE